MPEPNILLGKNLTLQECHKKCRDKKDCKYFVYGKNDGLASDNDDPDSPLAMITGGESDKYMWGFKTGLPRTHRGGHCFQQVTKHFEWRKCETGHGKFIIPGCGKMRPGCFDTYKVSTGQRGYNYHGCQNVTVGGHTCQAWASQSPHKHSQGVANTRRDELAGHDTFKVSVPRGFEGIEGLNVEEVRTPHNFCRNPRSSTSGPWCYTKSSGKRFQKCNTKEYSYGGTRNSRSDPKGCVVDHRTNKL